MHLYNLTLKPADAAIQVVVGNFSGSRDQEILVSHGTALEILRVDPQTGKLRSVSSTSVFASIRSIASVRLLGKAKDFIAVGSDSGRFTILEFSAAKGTFEKLQEETFGKSGARRIVPGQFLAVDPKGRSVMVAAVEQAKLVYTLDRDASRSLTISSPLTADSPGTIVHHVVGLDVGFENPMFAALEVNYTESDQDSTGEAARNAGKMLTLYELDLGLNHIVRKSSSLTDPRANLLVQVPGGAAGPSGVLVCCEDAIIFQPMDDATPHRVPIPRRREGSDRGLLIVAAVMHKIKDGFFFLLQSELGDLYKVTMDHSEGVCNVLKIKYFDTVPVGSSICILKSGFLFVASEFGNQCLYQFQTLGEDDSDQPEYSSAADVSGSAYLELRPLRNLVLTHDVPALNPIIQSKVLDLPESTVTILEACGRGPRSTLRVLEHGLKIDEVVSCDLRSTPNGLWVVKRKDGLMDTYIVLSFANATLVFSIDEALTEVRDTGFLTTSPTLAVQQMGTDSLVQVHPTGIRHIISPDGQAQAIREWTAPAGTTLVCAATNRRQVVVALSSAEIVYFELDLEGNLNEYQAREAMGSTVLALALPKVAEGRQRAPYLVVGCQDQTLRIMALDPENTFKTLSLQALSAAPASVHVFAGEELELEHGAYWIHIGLQNGVLIRTALDSRSGQLGETSSRFVGPRPVHLSPVKFQGIQAGLVMSSRAWISYNYNHRTRFTPLLCDAFQHGRSFSHELCPDGFVGIVGSELRIFRLPNIEENGSQRSIPLSHTPRQMVAHPQTGYLYIAESDHRTRARSATSVEIEKVSQFRNSSESTQSVEDDYQVFGRPRAGAGSWSSCIRVVDYVQGTTQTVVPLVDNEAAFSLAVVPFSLLNGEFMLVVGTATNVVMEPRSFTSAFLRTYKFTESGGLELYHVTEVDHIPLTLAAFQGRLLAGIGRALTIYEMGKQKLLRKTENSSFATTIVTLNTLGLRIIVGDMQQSLTFLAYKEAENRLIVVADDTQSRWVTCSTMVDYTTVVAGDRFGNIFVNRLDAAISDQADQDAGVVQEKGKLNGAPHKTQMIAHFHIGDLVTSVQKARFVAGARETILYTGLHGTIGLLMPLVSLTDVEFLQNLEARIRAEQTSLVGRDHLSWRGYYTPVKGVIDGDLCQTFSNLSTEVQSAISQELDYSREEIQKKLDQIRSTGFNF
ncbi:CPSF A subunit region-domain-containing protein [Mycena filopes]|nr:CPSF A subunit region-domain-containing protein [Mycena filopes]